MAKWHINTKQIQWCIAQEMGLLGRYADRDLTDSDFAKLAADIGELVKYSGNNEVVVRRLNDVGEAIENDWRHRNGKV